MKPGDIVATTKVEHQVFDEKGKSLLKFGYAPRRRTDCFVLLSLGTMPKGGERAAFAMKALIDMGWTPPAAEGGKG